MTKHLRFQGLRGSYAFHCHICLKLFLRLTRVTGEGSIKFEIFLGWFGTFFGLINFLRDIIG
jgi:hypothetical protein